jgi:hypothetical protein
MSGDSGVSKEELAAREEASLAFPGSALLEESGHDEGEGWGFDNMALTAMLRRRYATEAEPSAVVDWFNAKLSARGWRLALTRPDYHSYTRESEVLLLKLLGKPERPTTPDDTWEDADYEDADERYKYEVILEDATPAMWKQTPASLLPPDFRPSGQD